MIEKTKTKERTTMDIQALLIGVRRNKITGINRTKTAKKTTISLAKILVRSPEKT